MQVPNAVDGYFLHLLTGDEKRYFVRLKNHDTNGGTQLLWQGFILPDLYKEPYKNGALFVDFTAVDMLASLKGKTFEPWFYYTKFNLPRLLGYILAETGLQQEMYVKVAFENYRYGLPFSWREINLSLETFTDGKKYDDLYTILESVLQSQGLQILSFRGKWILQGFTRRQEASGIAEVYYHDGVYKESVTLNHDVVNPLFSTTPLINAETPYKSVNTVFNSDAESNFFTDDVVVNDDYYSASVVDEEFYLPSFINEVSSNWQTVGNPPLRVLVEIPYLHYKSLTDPVSSGQYNMSESAIRANYLECIQHPFLLPGLRYELEFEVYGTARITNISNIINRFEAGEFNFLCLFSLFHAGQEIISNRPGFLNSDKFQTINTYGPVSSTIPGSNVGGYWRFKKQFTVQDVGNVSFRFYPPLGNFTNPTIENFSIEPRVLKITLLDDFQDTESVSAVRDINYTTVFNVNLPLTNSVYSFIKKGFGYGSSDGLQYTSVVRGAVEAYVALQEISTGTTLQLNMAGYEISPIIAVLMFIRGGRQRTFLENADGACEYFQSLYYMTRFNRSILAFIYDYNGFPKLPPGYKTHAVLESSQTIKMMNTIDVFEDVSLRELWKIYGFTDYSLKTYAKTMAYAYHCTRPATIFNIDATALKLVWPLQRVLFRYLGQNRYFLPVYYKLSLFGGKTEVRMKEAILTELNDVSYE